MEQLSQALLWTWIVLPCQGIWLFVDARKRGAYPWFWGLWGLTYFPVPLLLYLIFVRKIFRKRRGE